ncbi:hypothetical protein CJ030_MR5G023527 [Morella rubra]|uniref:Uncharacterized protein n=1 Tax=Morella rubra TaxID=262757 RepID=A0A6A1VIS5_9ROSI|nr:hypothetical protein CJ030_MR5G023527 [Morella rubra]
MSQGTPACPSSCASTSASKRGRGRTRGVSLEKSLGFGFGAYPEGRVWRSVFHCCHSIDEDWNVGPRADSDLVNKWVDVPTEVKEYIMDRVLKRSEQNKKNRSKLTVNHAAGSRSFQRTRACMKNQESGNINPAELYKKNYTNKDGIWTSEGAREIYHQLAKARDEIEAMRAAREKDLQEFAKKQAEMEATLRDHREEQWVEQAHLVGTGGAHENGARAHASGARGAYAKGTRAHAKGARALTGRNIEGAGEENVLCNGEENERHVKVTIQPVWGSKR